MTVNYLRSSRFTLLFLISSVITFENECRLFATEPWSDSRLTVTDGLVVWLDASRLADASKAANKKIPQNGDAVSNWPDASGNHRDVLQNEEKLQPIYKQTNGLQSLTFDGTGQHLRASDLKQTLPELTLFVVSATYSNPEAFSAWLSMSEPNRNDFETGLNMDQGLGNPPSLQTVNVEGAGGSGMKNLLKQPIPYGQVTQFCLTSAAGKGGTELWVDGKPAGNRERTGSAPIHLDELVIGARRYALGSTPDVRGFFHGEIAEVLIFNRVLSKEDRTNVDSYLKTKYGDIAPLPVRPFVTQGKPLERLPSPPVVQVLVPGFDAQALPVDLNNINNLLYRDDNKLVALGYDGNVWLLTDTDGDGLEDSASLFWENKGRLRAAIGMDLTPPNYPAGRGVFVASKGKCSLLLDADGDDKAEKEIVIASGWKESPYSVDALGVAVDPKDASVYYGMGTADFTNPYLTGADGVGKFDLKSERGTIVRVAPDFKSREVICTGVRYTVGLRFNKAGDLFCTDQEGATWLPNGNPFDELLHIQRGRHYGFPPRHPRHLPEVIDEPSTFDYGPQHQSTTGLCFNEPVHAGGTAFGPPQWAGDLFVTGYSRGKIYRTQLAKTPNGYVARNSLFACLNMLPADCCVTPDGGMLVACHSGGPDWGSGPTGKGKLFKIRYVDREIPQPVLAWAAGQRELRVEFDRPVDPTLLRDALGQLDMTAGKYVRAGDRFESLWPGYAVVQMQHRTPRQDVKIYSAQLTPDHRTLVLATEPLSTAVSYALTMPGLGRPATMDIAAGHVPQLPQIDLDFELSGVEVEWKKQGQVAWSGWLPSPDLDVSRRWTLGSASHDRLWTALQETGELTLSTRLNLTDMLRPEVQPGEKINHQWPEEEVELHVASAVPGTLQLENNGQTNVRFAGRSDQPLASIKPQRGKMTEIQITMKETSLSSALSFEMTYSTKEDSRLRPFMVNRAYLPWVRTDNSAVEPTLLARPKELEGGSWARGWKIFHDQQTGCARCHSVQGQGGKIGPDLSNLIHRDYASVMRDVTQPNFAINPDYISSVVQLNDGRVITGVVRTIDGRLQIGDANGKTTIVAPDEVDEMRVSSVSVMPEGLLKTFSAEQIRDLMTYLLISSTSMPREELTVPRPAARSIAEVQAVLAGAPSQSESGRPLRIVLVAGPKDHGPGEHDYPNWAKAWSELLSIGESLEVVTATGWPESNEFQKADVMVFYQRGEWNAKRAADIDAFLERGGGLVYVHFAVDGQLEAPAFAKRIALSFGPGSKWRHGSLSIHFNHAPNHPVSRGFTILKLVDESYWNMTGNLSPERTIGSATEENQPQPLFWSLEQGRGRVFVSIPGHYSWTFDDPLFRVLLLRGIAWSAKESVDRFNKLVLPGADVAK